MGRGYPACQLRGLRGTYEALYVADWLLRGVRRTWQPSGKRYVDPVMTAIIAMQYSHVPCTPFRENRLTWFLRAALRKGVANSRPVHSISRKSS